MRDRVQSTAVASSDATETTISPPSSTTVTGHNPAYYDYVSHIWDEPTKETHGFKPCVHLSYNASAVPFDSWNGSDHTLGSLPNRALLNRVGFHYGQLTPPPTLIGHQNYISVTNRSADDIGLCVFNAYNQYVNGVRALDASQSIAEAGETPQLFNIWNRRKGLATNLTNGFLNYSFGWRPLLSDLRAISRELRHFRKTVRERLRRIGNKKVVRHYKFNLDDTVDDYNADFASGNDSSPYLYGFYERKKRTQSGSKRRIVTVTLRANVKPKLSGRGQEILNELGALGLIPSMATLWSVTRLSFVIDWFYNIGGAIENLQGSLTHDISNVEICVTDVRTRTVQYWFEKQSGNISIPAIAGTEVQRAFIRTVPTGRPILPILTYPKSSMQYILLGFLALTNTAGGKKLLRTADRYENLADKRLNRIEQQLNKLLHDKKILGH